MSLNTLSRGFNTLVLIFLFSMSAVGQRAVTSITATYQDLDDNSGDYSVNGTGSSDYGSGTMFNLSFSSSSTAANNLILDYITVGGVNYYLSFELATPIFRRTDNSVWSGDVEFLFHEINSAVVTDVDFRPSLAIDMETALNSSIVNRGTDNVFVNNDSGNGNNIERMDYVFSSGIAPGAAANQGFVLFERNGNDNLRIAAILSVDGSNNPTSFGTLLPITSGSTNWGGSAYSLTTTTFRDLDNSAAIDLRPHENIGAQTLKACWVTCDDLGIADGQTFYGYSLFAFDTPAGTASSNLLDWTNATYFPTNTASASGGSDMISGGLFLTTDFLPIELVDFTGTTENCQHQLAWTTATERSNDYFSVEQSFDGLQFSQIGRVDGAGNSDQAIDYQFDLELLTSEPAYYRLRQVDEDGTYAFSDVIRLESDCGQPTASLVEVFPNPVTKALRINGMSSEQGKGKAVIYNGLGARVKTKEFDLPEGKFIRTIDVNDLPTGNYFIHFQGTSSELSVQKFQKVE